MLGGNTFFNLNRIITHPIKQSSKRSLNSFFISIVMESSFIKPVVTLIGFEEGD